MSAPVLRRPDPLTLSSMSHRASLLRQHEHELDLMDVELAGLRRMQVAEARETLAALGFDVSGYMLPRYPHPLEVRSRTHPDGPTLHLRRVQAIAGRRGRLVRTCGEVLGVS